MDIKLELKSRSLIDWDVGMRLAGDNRELAKDLLALLLKKLPEDLIEIKQSADENNNRLLLQHIHKLHGAVSYCGVPRLKFLLHHIESNLKNQQFDDLPELLQELENEVALLLESYID